MTIERTPEDVAATTAQIQQSTAQIDGRLAQLVEELDEVSDAWDGTASESYRTARARWTSAVRDMVQLMSEIEQRGSSRGPDAAHRNRVLWG